LIDKLQQITVLTDELQQNVMFSDSLHYSIILYFDNTKLMHYRRL